MKADDSDQVQVIMNKNRDGKIIKMVRDGKYCVGTQRNLYSTDCCRGLASGLTQILGLGSGVWRRETKISTF